jgi:5-methylcytosine-specific restriction endonuclease McrBC GTP-binding regulatory subunit McrB
MSLSIAEREKLWDEFLESWPFERLATMSLGEYTKSQDKDSLCYWLEIKTESLGSMWGGSAFKFGIYSRSSTEEKSNGSGHCYSSSHAWLKKYGETPEAAFDKVRSIVVAVASASRRGDLNAIESADLGTVTKWKIAFLYQDREHPSVLPLYKAESLRAMIGEEAPKRCADMHRMLMAQRGSEPLMAFGQRLWEQAAELASAKLSSEDAHAWLKQADGLKEVKKATEYIAGFQLQDGRHIALELRNKVPTLYLSPGSWLASVADQVEGVEQYAPDKSRHGHLKANAPSLAQGNPVAKLKVPTLAALMAVVDAYEQSPSANATPTQADAALPSDDLYLSTASGSNMPLNQILYGPPGTGKTYATIERALRILDPALLVKLEGEPSLQKRRLDMKARFDVLKGAGRVRFVTFHQSFSYEDFVEGIRAQSGPNGLHYSVEPGVFKQLCEDAAGMPDVDKVIQQFLDDAADKPQALSTPKGKPFTVTYQDGNETVACLPASSTTNKPLPANIEAVKQVLRGQSPQKIYCESYVLGIVNHLKPKLPADAIKVHERQPHVLVIDEINRGNVSRIFGELITLIEPSKRAGQPEVLSTTLPYSREPFSVPDNVYLIGTMNTADRSLASLDVALRRRFVFEELPPEPALLSGVKVQGRVPLDELLSVINQRIEALLDRDHLIGHASFMPLMAEPTLGKLAEVFRRQVLPLLQEYFFEDWQRIQWVLNDHRKPKALQFVRQSQVKAADLFGAGVQVSARPLWEINQDAFANIEAYVGVINSPPSSIDDSDTPVEGQQ